MIMFIFIVVTRENPNKFSSKKINNFQNQKVNNCVFFDFATYYS